VLRTMLRYLALATVFALCSTVQGDYVNLEVVTNDYDNITSILPKLLVKAKTTWNSIIKTRHDNFTFTKSVNLNNYCSIDYTIESGTEIENLLVLIQFIETDSKYIASSEICAFAETDGTYFPRIGLITMDVSKSEEQIKYVLDNVMEHEIGHILGLGPLWNSYGLVESGAYTGSGAVYGYEQVGASDGVESVPVQTSDNSALMHWDDTILGTELMTGRMNTHIQPLSLITAYALTDIGYEIYSNYADSFTLLEDGPGNDTYKVWIDLFHDYTAFDSTETVPVLSNGKIASKSVTFSTSDSTTSTTTTSTDDRPSTWELVITVLFAVVVVALFATCGVCLYRRRKMRRNGDPTDPTKFDDSGTPPVHQNSNAMNAV